MIADGSNRVSHPNLGVKGVNSCCFIRRSGSKTVKASLLVFLALMALTPILKTLTEATSSDSIWALAFVLLNLFDASLRGAAKN